MLKFFLLLIIPLFIGTADADSIRKKTLPLDYPVSFAGNYGELRSGRFHAGLDFRVGGRVGERIYAIDEGYVSRISVSPVGYGNAVYITHPDSTTSVYGHMLDFAPEIAAKVREIQYSRKCFAFNEFFGSSEIPVAQHQFIGRVGNTGGSNGPHLHLEVRNPGNTKPVNPITNGYVKVEKDLIPPIFQNVNFYSYCETDGVVETALLRSFQGPYSGVVKLPGYSYVAVEAVDKQKNALARLAVEEYRVDFDGELLFKYRVGDFSYIEQLDFNGLIEYGEYVRTKKKMIKSYVEPDHGFSEKIEYVHDGLIVLKDDSVHKLTITICDQFDNKAVRTFKVQRNPASIPLPELLSSASDSNTASADDSSSPSAPLSEHTSSANDCNIVSADYGSSPSGFASSGSASSSYVAWYAPYVFIDKGIALSLPARALFRSIRFRADTIGTCNVPARSGVATSGAATSSASTTSSSTSGATASGASTATTSGVALSSSADATLLSNIDLSRVHSKIWRLHSPEVPLRTAANLIIAADVPDSLQCKALIASVSPKGAFSSCGGQWEGRGVRAKIGAFGTYCVVLDTIPPVANPRFKSGANISASGQLTYTISDELSGIASYSAEVDGEWILAKYDAKNRKLWITMDKQVVKKGKNHTVVLQVIDNKGNTKSVTSKFYW